MSDDPARTQLWGRFERAFDGPSGGNPFAEVTFGATFRQGDRSLAVPGFYDGDGVYRLRFMPDAEGGWSYVTHSSAPGLDGLSGTLEVGPAAPGRHGPVRAEGLQFRHADGTRYINIGTTAYAWTHQTEALQQQTLQTLAETPFTKIRMCVLPKHYRYNETEPELYPFRMLQRGSSHWPATQEEAGWAWDFDRIEPAFFRHLETRIAQLGDLGIEADLILMHPYDRWGFDHMSAEQDDRYLRYVVARLGAFANVWWSMANEYDLMPNKSPEDWQRFIDVVDAADPYRHLLSNHNCFRFFDFSHPRITHCSIQHDLTAHAARWRDLYGKPVSIDECCYEGDINEAWGNISALEMVRRFWSGVVNGGFVTHGETYNTPDETIWWGKGGTLRGESVARIAFLRGILEEAPDEGLEPATWTIPYRMTVSGDREAMDVHADLRPSPEEAGWEPKMMTWFDMAGQPGRWYLIYFGCRQPGEVALPVPPDQSYRLELIDTWAMTRTALPGSYARGDKVLFAPRPDQALIATRI